MKTYIITYTTDKNTTSHSVAINADTYTQAYVNASLRLPAEAEITDLVEIV